MPASLIDSIGEGSSFFVFFTAASAAAPWRQRFEDIAPGSVLRIDLPHAETDLSIKVGEHEALELSGSSSELAAQRAEHDAHPGSSLGALPLAATQHANLGGCDASIH